MNRRGIVFLLAAMTGAMKGQSNLSVGRDVEIETPQEFAVSIDLPIRVRIGERSFLLEPEDIANELSYYEQF